MKCYELFVDCEGLSHYLTQTKTLNPWTSWPQTFPRKTTTFHPMKYIHYNEYPFYLMPADDNLLGVFSEGPRNDHDPDQWSGLPKNPEGHDEAYSSWRRCSLQGLSFHGEWSWTLVRGGTPPPCEGSLPKDYGAILFHFLNTMSNILWLCSWSFYGSRTWDWRNTWSKTPSHSGIHERGACRDDGDEAHGHHDEEKGRCFQGPYCTVPVGLKHLHGGQMNKDGEVMLEHTKLCGWQLL